VGKTTGSATAATAISNFLSTMSRDGHLRGSLLSALLSNAAAFAVTVEMSEDTFVEIARYFYRRMAVTASSMGKGPGNAT
jgi:hypothetical protein